MLVTFLLTVSQTSCLFTMRSEFDLRMLCIPYVQLQVAKG